MSGLAWVRRPEPLRPAAVLAAGSARAALARGLTDRIHAGADLQVHASDTWLLAVGEESDLPWVDGATWLGREAGLLVPTTLLVQPEPDLVARAIRRTNAEEADWIVLLPDRILTGRTPLGLPDLDALGAIAGSTRASAAFR